MNGAFKNTPELEKNRAAAMFPSRGLDEPNGNHHGPPTRTLTHAPDLGGGCNPNKAIIRSRPPNIQVFPGWMRTLPSLGASGLELQPALWHLAPGPLPDWRATFPPTLGGKLP